MTQAETVPHEKPGQPQRRWCQYSLRTMLIFTTIVAVWLAWWSYKAERERRALETLRKSGAIIYFYKANFLGIKRVLSVSVHQPIPNKDIAALQELGGLETVYVQHNANDEDFARVAVALPKCNVWLEIPEAASP